MTKLIYINMALIYMWFLFQPTFWRI